MGSVAGIGRLKDAADPLVYAFVIGTDRRLYVSYSTEYRTLDPSWGWFPLGQPKPNIGLRWIWRPGIVEYFHDEHHRLYTFVGGEDGHLWVHIWRGLYIDSVVRRSPPDFGIWGNQGMPAPGVEVASAASAITHPHEGRQQMYAFVRGSNNRLYAHFWNAASGVWAWRDLGQPTNATVRSAPSAVVCNYPASDPIYVFIRGNDNHLHMCHMDSGVTNWEWRELSEE